MTGQLQLRVLFIPCDCTETRGIRHESTVYVHPATEREAAELLLRLRDEWWHNFYVAQPDLRYWCICVPGRGHAQRVLTKPSS